MNQEEKYNLHPCSTAWLLLLLLLWSTPLKWRVVLLERMMVVVFRQVIKNIAVTRVLKIKEHSQTQEMRCDGWMDGWMGDIERTSFMWPRL